ncbi:E3 ubiquitin-protein ligase makorin-1 [Elysia marginata]|uniref:RING-type E3 ubiquitin transferase n=1 Tax=Elysia marginata TaxID=1093978 RepID=A0AAV4FWE5_9GAST|nr:E3 ubiquitin-protein ligase makorin-1 [Elysia marginata]
MKPQTTQRPESLSSCRTVTIAFVYRVLRNKGTTEDGGLAMRKTCLVCRTSFGFIIPSEHWVEKFEEKQFIGNYKKKVFKSKPCRYFRRGRGVCPNGTECTYLHALPDRTEVEGNDYDCNGGLDQRPFLLQLSTSIVDVLQLFVRDMRPVSVERQSSSATCSPEALSTVVDFT